MKKTVIDEKMLHQLKLMRWKARTDLIWLCNNVLGFPDINEKIHGPLI
jgi:hypothetical protein